MSLIPLAIFDNTTEMCQCACGDGLDGIVNCDNAQEKVYIDSCYCMTHDIHLGTIAGACMTNCF